MSLPIEMTFGAETIFLHEYGCKCGLDHDGRFVSATTKCVVLTLVDERAKLRYYQIWFRTGLWDLHQACESLIERKRSGQGGKAA